LLKAALGPRLGGPARQLGWWAAGVLGCFDFRRHVRDGVCSLGLETISRPCWGEI